MATIAVFLAGGIAFGGGLGFILGYFTGKRHGLRAARPGFPVETRGH